MTLNSKNQTPNRISGRSNHTYSERAGVSLLLGLGIIFIMVFFSLLVGNVVVSSIRQTSNVSRSNEAYYAAEGALEQGLLDNYLQEAGYTSETKPVNYASTTVTANYQVQGTVPEELKYGPNSTFNYNKFSIPTPGSGNAGLNCDSDNPIINKRFLYNTSTKLYTFYENASTGYDPSDFPCNWNKIRTGETVTIPLYYEDENGNFINLFNEVSNELKIRIRTSCLGGHEFCLPTSSTGRYKFENTSTEPKPQNDPIITWQIEGLNPITGKTESLRPFISYSNLNEFSPPIFIFSESVIDGVSGSNYIVKKHVVGEFSTMKGVDLQNNWGCAWQFFGAAQTGAMPCNSSNPWANRELVKPVLKLSVIGALINARTSSNPVTLTQIPFLEYQIITSSNLSSPPTNLAQNITAEGISGTFKQILEVSQPQAGGLPDYVVQQ